MDTQIVVRSISRQAKEQLQKSRFSAQVLAVFERACNLVTLDGNIIALVTPHIGNGPLNIVVDGAAGHFGRIGPDAPVTLEQEQLRVGELLVNLEEATIWEPRPDWAALRARRAVIASHLPLLRDLCLHHSPASTLLPLLGATVPNAALAESVFSKAQDATQALRTGWSGDLERLQAGGVRLAGLGSGLTPAGDDFLIGVMLWAWLAHPDPDSFCHALVKVAVPRTTTLSGAFLQATAEGYCNVSWHRLLEALSSGIEAKITAAMLGVLARGATSGADSLVGFLYMNQSLRV